MSEREERFHYIYDRLVEITSVLQGNIENLSVLQDTVTELRKRVVNLEKQSKESNHVANTERE